MNKLTKYILVLFMSISGNFIVAQTLDIHIKNIRNTKGQLCLAIFADEESFKVEKPCWNLYCSKKNIVNNEFHIQIPFRSGKWAFSVLDDENQSGKMEYNLIGIPKEGVGFSDYFLHGLHRPVFNDFCFVIAKNETRIITVRMKYF